MLTLGLNLTRVLLLLALLAAAAAGTATASGGGGSESPPAGPTLQGENLVATFTGLTVTSDCDETSTSTVSYHAEGLATGPFFPGTFVADGTITIGAQSEETLMGPIETLTETFTILSGDTTITGSKTLTPPLEALGERERATCQDLTVFGGVTGTGRLVEVEAATTYQATIETPLGSFEDSGRATPVLTLVEITGECEPGIPCESRNATFDQLFTLSDQAEPPPVECDDDEDGDSQGGDGDDQGCDEDEGEQ
jgi:hypothetical protein